MPAQALAASPHATVPSLVLSGTEFMDESWDIVKWAMQKNDPENWSGQSSAYLKTTELLVATNDASFKQDLDHYKYADRHPQHPIEYYRQRGETFLTELNSLLEEHNFLLADTITVADIAVFPFIRQFAMVDQSWFDQAPYPELQRWLARVLKTEWFREAFMKREIWKPGNEEIYL